MCETPKSPPGDYNFIRHSIRFPVGVCIECETPKSPPGDYNDQNITLNTSLEKNLGVKHLNPRQGITTFIATETILSTISKCETPKSPPGDYNQFAKARTIL